MINGLAEKLRDMRNKAGISQRTVAQKLQVSPSIISGYETGERTPSVEILLALSYLYRCSTDYLLGKEQGTGVPQLDLTGLSDAQIRILAELIDSMRK